MHHVRILVFAAPGIGVFTVSEVLRGAISRLKLSKPSRISYPEIEGFVCQIDVATRDST